MHSSQMYTPGPAMSFLTSFCDLPQKLLEKYQRQVLHENGPSFLYTLSRKELVIKKIIYDLICTKEVYFQELYFFLEQKEIDQLELNIIQLEINDVLLFDQQKKYLKINSVLGTLHLRSICQLFDF